MKFGWTPGLGVAFLTYSQLYILCDIGNEVDAAVSFFKQNLFKITRKNEEWFEKKCGENSFYKSFL